MSLFHSLPVVLASWEEITRCRLVTSAFHYVGVNADGDDVIHTDDLEQAYSDPRVWVIITQLLDGHFLFFKVIR